MKGLLFERLFAFELTTFGSGVADVVCKKLSVRGRKMQIDAHMCGADWVVRPTIMENWQEGSMHCVSEASNERGRRKVDVGFPLLNEATSSTETWRVYCELKCGYKPGKLWELCWKFLQEMENLAFVSNPHVCAVFVASIPFENCTNLLEDAGPAEAKRKILEHDRYNDGRFFILDGLAFQEESLSGLLGKDTEKGLDYLCKASQIVGRSDVHHVSDSQCMPTVSFWSWRRPPLAGASLLSYFLVTSRQSNARRTHKQIEVQQSYKTLIAAAALARPDLT